MSWTDERVEILTKLWGEGRTAAEIAKELGGVTRNAVIGKAHRLKLSGRASPIQQTKKPANTSVPKAPTPVEKKAQVVAPVIKPEISDSDKSRKRIPMTELGPSQCRWPIGDPEDENFGFCGDHAEDGSPYCAEHSAVAYQTMSKSRQLSAEDLEKEEAARAERMALQG